MEVDLSRLETLYAGFSETQFFRLRRKDLVAAARPYYDRERERRGLPEYEMFRPDPHEVFRQAHRKRRNGYLLFLVYAIPLCGFIFYFRLYGYGVVVMLALLLMSVTQPYRGDDLVVWLRRFHTKWHKKARFDRKLIAASRGFGFAVTIQDSKIKRSGFAALLVWKAQLTSFLGTLPIGLLLFVPVVRNWIDESNTHLIWALSVFLVIYLCWMLIVYQRLGFVRLSATDAAAQVRKAIAKTEQNGHGLLSEILLLKCPDSCWREAVQECMRQASVLIIDVTEPSENVIWELQESLRVLPRELLVLTCAVQKGKPEELTASAHQLLLSVLGEGELKKMPVFFYPINWRFPKDVRAALELRLANAVADSEYLKYLRDRYPEVAKKSVGFGSLTG